MRNKKWTCIMQNVMKKPAILLIVYISIFSLCYCFANETSDATIRITSRLIPESSDDAMSIKVLLYETNTITIGSTEYVNVYDNRSRAFLSTFSRLHFPITISLHNGLLTINEESFETKGLFILSPSQHYSINGKHYKGALSVIKRGEKFLIVNEVDLETYVKGVLPSEMFSKWPQEALKAQAVVSRTFAVFAALERKGFDYHVSDTQLSQVYGGISAQVQATDDAVDMTRGEVLLYDENIFPSFFHSTCGGHTTNAEYVWKVEPHPSLTTVYCPFCWQSKHYTWTNTLSFDEIETRLHNKGLLKGSLSAFRKGKTDAAGRVVEFEIESDKEIVTINANELRVFVFPDIFKSTLFKMGVANESIIFQGFGWGHGVGMCQWGSQKMASDGYDYNVILSYYYPRSFIKKLPEGYREYYDLIM
ncbi:SpoIID/LytB domain-containing protein [Candidatus Omnitrophota bacterium]